MLEGTISIEVVGFFSVPLHSIRNFGNSFPNWIFSLLNKKKFPCYLVSADVFDGTICSALVYMVFPYFQPTSKNPIQQMVLTISTILVVDFSMKSSYAESNCTIVKIPWRVDSIIPPFVISNE